VVCIDNSSANKAIPSIVIDNFNAVVDSVNYLSTLGHDRIGFITGLDDSDVGRNRFAGYLNALQRNGISQRDELIFKGDYTYQTGIDGADYLLSLNTAPTAIVCANDTMALGVLKKLSQEGISVPDDISVIGFDDIRVASHMTPALTTVAAPIVEIARHAVDMLQAMISGTNMDNRHIILPGQLKLRDTCAPLRNHINDPAEAQDAVHN
jgi:DNA-binding LacI/PurR family transcriptional regulator